LFRTIKMGITSYES